jgi:fucose permease
MASPNTESFKRTAVVWLLYVLLGLFSFALCMIGPAIPYLKIEFKLDYTMSALHLSMFAMGMVVSGFLSPPLLDRLGLFRGLWGGIFGMVLGAVLLVLAPSPWLTLLSILLMSLTGTFCLTAIQASISGLFTVWRGKALMEANMVASLFSALPPFLLVLGSATFLGWRILTPAFALAVAATALLGWQATRQHSDSTEANTPDAPGRLPARFWLSWLIIFFGVATEWCAGFWAAEHLKGLPGGSLAVAATGAGVFQIAAVAGRFLSSRLAGRLSEIRIMLVAIVLVAAGFPLYWLRADVATAFIGLALCGMGVSTFYPLGLSLAVEASGGRLRKASSYAPIGSGLAIGLAPLVLGRVADGLDLQAALLAIPVCLAAMVLLIGARRLAQSRRA